MAESAKTGSAKAEPTKGGIAKKNSKNKLLEYKGHPLMRTGNIVYYGSMKDKYIIMMQILETRKVNDLDVATKIFVQLALTDPNLKAKDRMVKKTEKGGLYDALDIGEIWLNRALATK